MRKTHLMAAVLAVFVTAGGSSDAQQKLSVLPAMQVYKTPTCGCCSKWVEHMRKAGFTVQAKDISQDELNAVKAKYGVPPSANSCHTARLGSYIVEGHIPADAVKKMLKERPRVVGIAVPGMPIGSPGMEVPGVRAQQYDVLSFDKTGATKVFLTIKP